MKSARHVSIVLAAIVLFALPASAVPDGPDGDPYRTGYFSIFVGEGPGAPLPRDTYSITKFPLADGWDFGDRYGYRCAWVEFFQGSTELFEVHYEMRDDYPFPALVNDKYGVETKGPGGKGNSPLNTLCGTGVEAPTSGKGSVATHDGTDHHPHGTGFTFFKDGTQIAELPLMSHQDHCARAYWAPGDEAGEAWLWWDEDGPTDTMPGLGDCPGGPGEPVTVLRLIVQNVRPGVTYCVMDHMDGDLCASA